MSRLRRTRARMQVPVESRVQVTPTPTQPSVEHRSRSPTAPADTEGNPARVDRYLALGMDADLEALDDGMEPTGDWWRADDEDALPEDAAVIDDPNDAHAMRIVGEEVAHGLANGGSGHDPIDRPGDPGEARASDAGERFAAWMADGRRGPAPRLQPATGGRARIHPTASSPPNTRTRSTARLRGSRTTGAARCRAQRSAIGASWT